MTYKILFDYGSEGMKFWDDQEYPTVNEAVKFALELNTGTRFLIVSVIDWHAQEIIYKSTKEV